MQLIGTVLAYKYMEDLVKLDGCQPRDGPPVLLGKKVTTPLAWEECDRALTQHPDQ